MDYEKQIAEHRDDPEELERLYHEKPQAFASCLERVRENHPEAALHNVWHARLSYSPARATGRKALGELLVMLGLCVAAGLAVKLPLFWGHDVWKVDLGALFLASLAIINVMPATEPFHTRLLSILHLPLLLWLGVGVAFCGNEWRNPAARLDFLRSTGELFVYTVLILLGGGVLTGFTLGIFSLIGLDISRVYISWVAAVGLFAAPIVGAYLTEKKRELAESFAPMLSWIFTPSSSSLWSRSCSRWPP